MKIHWRSGLWKTWEKTERSISQKKSFYFFCFCFFLGKANCPSDFVANGTVRYELGSRLLSLLFNFSTTFCWLKNFSRALRHGKKKEVFVKRCWKIHAGAKSTSWRQIHFSLQSSSGWWIGLFSSQKSEHSIWGEFVPISAFPFGGSNTRFNT